MQKEKLKQVRIQKGFSQQDMADVICRTKSNYNRKENGFVGIHDEEWQKLAEALEVSVEDIFEEDKTISINYENSTIAENSGNFSTYNNIPESIVKNLQDFISHLLEENAHLKAEINLLKGKN
jgi:transcriptional regulator with XRE-family HTH domain